MHVSVASSPSSHTEEGDREDEISPDHGSGDIPFFYIDYDAVQGIGVITPLGRTSELRSVAGAEARAPPNTPDVEAERPRWLMPPHSLNWGMYGLGPGSVWQVMAVSVWLHEGRNSDKFKLTPVLLGTL